MNSALVFTMLAAAETVTVPPPAPPPLTIIMQPPSSPRIVEQRSDQALAQFDVVVTAEREVLWSDTVRVGTSGVNYSQSLRQAEEPCPNRASIPEDGYRYVENARQITFTLSRRGSRDVDSYAVNVRWQRPVAACQGGGNRGVTLDQQIDIAPGETVRLKGDADLEVRLTRRTG